MSIALVMLDGLLCKNLDDGCEIHDTRSLRLPTKMGYISFIHRRIRDKYNYTIIPLVDALDLPWHTRISPVAKSFLAQTEDDVSCAKADYLHKKDSRVSTSAVM